MKTEMPLGVWYLISCEGRGADGGLFLPWGSQPIGRLIYTHDGHLAVSLMSSGRQYFASEDISKAINEEVAAAFRSFDAYSGRWRLDEGMRRIKHLIEAGRIPNWVNKNHARYCSVEDGCLSLATEGF